MSARRALLFSFLDRYAGLVLSIASSMFIARLLTPQELGVFSVTMVLIMFASSMRDMGAGQYLVQEKELDRQQISAVWTVLLFMGAAMAVLVLAAAWPVAAFYKQPAMVPLMCVIALNFMVSPFGSMTYAWLMREMRFESLAVMRFGSSLAGAVTSVALAWLDYGPMSLAIGNLVATLVNAALALYFRPARFGWWPHMAGVKRVLTFGSKVSASGLIWNLASGAPELFLGKLQGMSAAAYYSRGNGLAVMFQRLVLDATQSVALPLFAKAKRESGDFNDPFARATSYITALGWAFFAGMALLAHPIMQLLYGPQWDPAVNLTRLLALGMAVGLPAAMCPQALMAAGQASGLLKFSVFGALTHVLCIGVGAVYGFEAAAVGFIVAQASVAAGWLWLVRRLIKLRLRALLPDLLCSGLVAATAAAAPATLIGIYGLRPANGLALLVVSATAGTLMFGVALMLLKHPLADEIHRALMSIRARFQPP
jgi:O-antigen/teichoic acid export membrane protein